MGEANVAKKIKRAYIGDETGKARLFYTSGYVWKKYNTNITHTYWWNKYNVTSTIEDFTLGWGPTEDIDVARNEQLYSNIEFDPDRGILEIDRNSSEQVGTIINESRDEDLNALIGWYQAPVRPTIVNDCYKITAVYGTRGNLIIECGGRYCDIQANTVDQKGSLVGSVSSTSRGTYPSNGVSGSYWYVYDRDEVSYSQGSYISDVENDDPSAYPM